VKRRESEADLRRLRSSASLAGLVLLLIWATRGVESGLGMGFGFLGIQPRQLAGLPGIFLAPLLHADWMHTFTNSAPLFVLLTGLLYHYRKVAPTVLASIWLAGGLAVWLCARPAFHIGASGLNYGLASFLFLAGVLQRERSAIALALLVTFLYGSMIWGVLPADEHISWEAHLFSSLVGLSMAVWLRWRYPPPTPDRLSWEEKYAQGINEDNVWTDYEGYDPENLGDDPERGIYR